MGRGRGRIRPASRGPRTEFAQVKQAVRKPWGIHDELSSTSRSAIKSSPIWPRISAACQGCGARTWKTEVPAMLPPAKES